MPTQGRYALEPLRTGTVDSGDVQSAIDRTGFVTIRVLDESQMLTLTYREAYKPVEAWHRQAKGELSSSGVAPIVRGALEGCFVAREILSKAITGEA